ncbi:rod shape-determining protein RodA [soil metagenome]
MSCFTRFSHKLDSLRFVLRSEITLPVITAFLLAAGLLTLSSAAPEGAFVVRQAVYMGIGLALSGVVLWLGRQRLMAAAYPLYGFSLGLLVLTQLVGTEKNGAKSWLNLGPLPEFQPSELAKIALILALAVALHERPIRGLLGYVRPLFIIFLPFALVFLEPDLGSALVLAAIGGGMMLVRGLPWKHLVFLGLVFAVALPTVVPTMVWPHLKPHQRERLVIFLNPEADPQGSGYQVIQSRIAIGSGGLLGKGYKQGTQAQNGFIPYRYADFIFPVLAEEGGFVAAVSLLLLYGLLFWRLSGMAAECPLERDQLVIAGVLSLLGFQVLVNVGVALGLAPVTGITLPLISFGGTSLISTMIALSLVYLVHRDRHKDW